MDAKKFTFLTVAIVVLSSVLGVCPVTYAQGTWTITQLTYNETDDCYPAISGTNVVWQHGEGNAAEIYSNFGWSTNNTFADTRPDISGDNVVWQQGKFATATQWTEQICSNFAGVLSSMIFNFTPKISGENVVWISSWYYDLYKNNWNVFSNFPDPDGQLSFNKDHQIWSLAISGDIAVWVEDVDLIGRIINSNVLGPITTSYGTAVAISGENVVWVQPSPLGGHNIFSNFNWQSPWDGIEDQNPAISGTNVVWQQNEGDAAVIRTNFGGQVPSEAIRNCYPDISGNTVVWQGWDGQDWEIYMATYSTNAPSVANPGGPYAADEGSEITFDGSGSSDPDGDALTYAWDFGDGTTGSGSTPTHTYADNGTYNICLAVTGPAGASDTQCTTAEIANVAPIVGPIDGPTNPIQLGTSIVPNAEFTDPGRLDTHSGEWDWGDGNIDAGTLDQGAGGGSVAGAHGYSEAGIYTVRLTVTDKDGDSATSEFRYAVVYDPAGGFVTGGGWIDSPPGAYFLDPTQAGKANFGFVSKYQKGANVPTGNTEFQFKAGNLNFHSSSYQWLVVNQSGSNAQFKGSGTINDGGLYKFMLWARDGVPDTFRIKIWTEDALGNETVTYDNGFDQAIGGGSIVIHTK